MINKPKRLSWPELCVICYLRGTDPYIYKQLKNRKTFSCRLTDVEADIISKINIGASFIINEDISFDCILDDGSYRLLEKNLDGVSLPVVYSPLRYPQKNRKKSQQFIQETGKNVLVIGDLHAPFVKHEYLNFCKRIYSKYNCSQVIFIGDLLDNHFSSYHETNPDGMGAGEELSDAEKIINDFHEAFPVARVCIGNHDSIPNRKAFSSGVSSRWVKSIGDVLKVPGWEFAEEWTIDGVLYTHGIARKARQRSQREYVSVVQGHYHSETYYETFVSENRLIFAMQIGCGLDRRSYAAYYGRHFNKPQINVGVVMDSGRWGLIEHMIL